MLSDPRIFHLGAQPRHHPIGVAKIRYHLRQIMDRPVLQPGLAQPHDIALAHLARRADQFFRKPNHRAFTVGQVVASPGQEVSPKVRPIAFVESVQSRSMMPLAVFTPIEPTHHDPNQLTFGSRQGRSFVHRRHIQPKMPLESVGVDRVDLHHVVDRAIGIADTFVKLGQPARRVVFGNSLNICHRSHSKSAAALPPAGRTLNPMPTNRDIAIRILRTLRDAGHTAYFAGGCVRDELLHQAPSDYDIATDAHPQRVRSLFKNTNEVGASFGVILVRLSGCTIEVTTFREEGAYTDRRRPDDVRYADAPSDARRRDFTINALFLDPPDESTVHTNTPSSCGKIIDFVGGVDDLHQRIIRAVGDPEKRLAEDHLRALRAARFAARLGFTIDPATARAIRQHASELAGVSRERIGGEIRRMLTDPNRSVAVALLEELDLDRVALGEATSRELAAARVGVVCELPGAASLPLALAGWAIERALREANADTIAAIAQPLRSAPKRWRRELSLSNDDHTQLSAILDAAIRLSTDWSSLAVAPRKHLAASPGFDDALILLQIVEPALAKAVASDLDALQSDGVGIHPPPHLTGDDLIRLGARPGPKLGGLLRDLYNRQLEGGLRTRTDAEACAQDLLASRPSADDPDSDGIPADCQTDPTKK